MKKIILCLMGVVFGFYNSVNGFAEPANESMKPVQQFDHSADNWIGKSEAVVRVLNKLEAHTETLTIPVGQSVRYQTLTIEALHCVERPPSVPFDSAAFLQVTDTKLNSIHFSAWVFVSEPGVSVFEHPLYNISVVGCTGERVNEPVKNQQETEQNHQKPGGQSSSESIENSLEHALQSQH